MNELIKITLYEGKNIVNARNLHEILKPKSKFADWIKNRITKYNFIDNQDYVTVSKNLENGGRSIEYGVTIDMAKQLCMVENNDKGAFVRLYFIECEKKLKEVTQISLPDFNNPALAARAWADEYEQKQIAQAKVLELTPKAEFYDAVASSKKTMSMAEVAKVLNVPGMGQNNLFAKLREKKILMANNNPYQIYVTKGYFKLIEQKFNKPSGSVCLGFKTVVYQKGLDFIRKILTGQTLLQLTSN